MLKNQNQDLQFFYFVKQNEFFDFLRKKKLKNYYF